MYRCLQHAVTVPSEIFCNVKFALHSTVQLIVADVSSFGLIKCRNELLDKSAMGFSFLLIICSVLDVVIYGWEGFFLVDLEDQWKNYSNKLCILIPTKRTSYSYKTAR